MAGFEPSVATLSQAEVVKTLKALTDGDKTALMKIARAYATKTSYGHEDLFQEAICRILSGTRAWPRNVPVVMTNLKGKVEMARMRELFPKPFDSSNL